MKHSSAYVIFLLLLIVAVSCQTGNTSHETSNAELNHSAAIERVFEAHGGYARWLQMKQLSFDLDNGEHQVISLKDRKVLIESDEKTIGFDGREVWVTPATAEIGNARFYHNLYFYFYAMPFVLGDPGTIYEEAGTRTLLGEEYEGIKVSFRDDVGDSPKDNYILYYDPETYRMSWLMYTVTYFSQRKNNQYSLIRYDDWHENNGLLLPARLQWYAFENDAVGEVQSERIFKNVQISAKAPSSEIFRKPVGAGVAPRPTR